jgi:hypothetical protein
MHSRAISKYYFAFFVSIIARRPKQFASPKDKCGINHGKFFAVFLHLKHDVHTLGWTFIARVPTNGQLLCVLKFGLPFGGQCVKSVLPASDIPKAVLSQVVIYLKYACGRQPTKLPAVCQQTVETVRPVERP